MERMVGGRGIGLGILVMVVLIVLLVSVGVEPISAALGLELQNPNTGPVEQEVGAPGANNVDEAKDHRDRVKKDKVKGEIDSIRGHTIVIDGVSYQVPGTLLDELTTLTPGSTIGVEFFVDPDGNLVIIKFGVGDNQGENADENAGDQVENAGNPSENADENADDQDGNADDQGDNADDQGSDNNNGSDKSRDGI